MVHGVTVGGHVIDMFLLPKKGTPVLHNSNSKLLENWAWARSSLSKSPSYRGHVTHICVTKKKSVSSIKSPQENIGDELLENISTDDNFENVEFDDDKILISSVELHGGRDFQNASERGESLFLRS